MTAPLTLDDVAAHLLARGVLAAPPDSVSVLAGGVSGATYLVTGPSERLVVKQPLPFLSVADEWPARMERAAVEAAALSLVGTLTPEVAPRLLDFDPERFVLVMAAAPASWVEWRTQLLGGTVVSWAGTTLGSTLGRWHSATVSDLPEVFTSLDGFLELRGDPYHRTVAARRTDLAPLVSACLDELLAAPTCFVHGDFSPKNVLIGPDSLWALDFEVAHRGNPVFDVAFMLHHLTMKAIHLPALASPLEDCALAFWRAYGDAGGLALDEPAVLRHTGALLLARVHGKSPTAYLTPAEAEQVSLLGERALRGGFGTLAELFAR
ncbi:phosphotransferase family protein [Tenggerimyces flavus]|uniref:Phosphotransferase family protein n=1 Tax=Tenggerimyces flavus TaxID=1708749 RepID=A0ABV7YFJ7_9ACTN|nr:aminoglycoside phosphotransferase family protein [Tenggerimyces flavus]MBM7783899.1 5-methylthioribose kinase [Tenggerimyces flavus]